MSKKKRNHNFNNNDIGLSAEVKGGLLGAGTMLVLCAATSGVRAAQQRLIDIEVEKQKLEIEERRVELRNKKKS